MRARRSAGKARAALALVGVLGAGTASGAARRDAGTAKDTAPAAAVRPEAAAQEAVPHDPDDEDEEEGDALPANHPAVQGNPHGGAAAQGGMPGMFRAPQDSEKEDPSLPPGSIAVDLRDADDKPVPGELITLGELINSVANGDSRKHFQATTDERGRAQFSGLDIASNIAYRVSSGYQGGSFGATPFQIPQGKAIHVVLHVYQVVRDIRDALVVSEAAVAAEMRDDRIQIEEALTIYNLGKTAWQPDDTTMALPSNETAFSAQPSMTGQGVDESSGTAKLHGTFPPGQSSIQFRWQLPWSSEKDVDFDVGLPPHAAIARVILAAAGDVKLSAAGFPAAEVRKNNQGQLFLVTEKQVRPDQGVLKSLSISIRDLPVPGPGRLVATVLASFGILVGVVLATFGGRRRMDQSPARQKARILEELLFLEEARAANEVGPQTYERARRGLIDALANVLSRIPA
jgi:hypothetical protein